LFATPGDAPTAQPQLPNILTSAALPPPASPAEQEPQLEPLCAPEDLDCVTREVRDFVSTAANQRAFADYHFGRLYMLPRSGDPFNDEPALAAVGAGAWPTAITAKMSVLEGDVTAVTSVALVYPQLCLEHGRGSFCGRTPSSVSMAIDSDECIAGVRTWNANYGDGFNTLRQLAVRIVKVKADFEEWRTLGDGELQDGYVELCAPRGFAGLKGFHGLAGDAVDSLGPIWGR
jgi:hypothetical protein